MIDELWETQEEDLETPSKSQRKREMLALQVLGGQLLGRSAGDLQRLPLSEKLGAALLEGQRITSHSARRRHVRYLAKLLSGEEPDGLAAARRLLDSNAGAARLLHLTEQWRDRLIAEGDAALHELETQFPQADAQKIRQLIHLAQRESQAGKPPAARRQLFRLLRGLLAA